MAPLSAFVIFLLFAASRAKTQLSLNRPNLLLPYAVDEASKTFFVLKGICPTKCCFVWSSNRPELALVESIHEAGKEDEGCSVSARVTATSSHAAKKSAIVMAKDQISGQSFRCDVFIDAIKRIEIRTTSKDLIIDEAPKALHVQGFDAQENMFTALSNHPFDWSLVSWDGKDDPTHHVRLLTYSDSRYETSEENLKLERTGLKGDTILVEGLSMGLVRVMAKLAHPSWKSVNSHQVVLQVVENVQLLPSSDVYILMYSYVDFTVEKQKHEKFLNITLPSDHYRLSLTNSKIGRLDPQLSRVTGIAIGVTDVQLLSKYVDPSYTTRIPSTTVHVIPPAYLVYEISGWSWVVQVGKTYEISIHAFGSHNHRLQLTENVRIEALFPKENLKVVSSAKNGSYHVVTALKIGDVTLTAVMKKIVILETGKMHLFERPVSAEQPMEILSPIVVIPRQVVLPWTPKGHHQFSYQFQALGGSGNYEWSIDSPKVAQLNQSGVATALQKGVVRPKASEPKNANIFNASTLHIVPPSHMQFLNTVVEALVGTTLDLPLAVKGIIDDTPVVFHDCRYLNLSFDHTEQTNFKVIPYTNYTLSDIPSGACAIIRVEALHPGHSSLTATYSPTKVSASILLGAYTPLQVVHPPSPALVTVGSSFVYQFEGGLLPWPLELPGYVRDTETKEKALAFTSLSEKRGGIHQYRIFCRSIGDQTMVLTVRNKVSAKNKFPKSSNVSAKILCHEPFTALLRPVKSDLLEKCPLFEKKEFHVASSDSLQLQLTAQDKEGRSFDNFTSMDWIWSKLDQTLFTIKSDKANDEGNKRFIQLSIVPAAEGFAEIMASCKFYSKMHMAEISQTDKKISELREEVKDTLLLKLQGDPVIVPSIAMIYNHPSNTANLDIHNGSGYYEVAIQGPKQRKVIKYNHEQGSSKITIYPVEDGQAFLSARDLCLITPVSPPMATIRVSGIYSLDVIVADKVQVGHSVVASVRVLDLWGNSLPVDQYKFIHLRPHALAPILRFSDIEDKHRREEIATASGHGNDFVLFDVHGLVEGMTQVVFNATSPSKKLITSQPAPIQVFSNIQVKPERVILIPTATFQILVIGGPRHDTRFTFQSANMSVSTVDTIGLITAVNPGQTTVLVASEATDGSGVVYSKAQVHVLVLKLTGLKIHVPSDEIIVGSEVAIYVVGQHEETPFSFASAVPLLQFHWESSNENLVSLHSVYHQAGFSLDSDPDFAIRLRTNRVGQSTISVRVDCPPNACIPDQTTLTQQTEIQVLDALKLISPASGRLLLPHNAYFRIRTNRDGECVIVYRVVSSIDGRQCQDEHPGPVRVGEDGRITTGSLEGAAVIIVTAIEPYGINQTALIHVEVKPVIFLTINSLSSVRGSSDKFHSFPIGYTAHFAVSLHDVVGRQFDFNDLPLVHQMNKNDIVRLQRKTNNGTFLVKGIKLGEAIVKIQLADVSQISDYIRVRIDYALQPKPATIHEGCTVCITSHLFFDQGIWSSSEPRILQIDSSTGKVFALSPGRSLVSYKAEDFINTHVEVNVSPVRMITISKPNTAAKPLSNCLSESGCFHPSFNLEFYANDLQAKFTAFHDHGDDCSMHHSGNFSHQVDFVCGIQSDLHFYDALGKLGNVADLFDAVAYFNHLSGSSHCLVQLKQRKDMKLRINHLEGHVTVWVEVKDSERARASVHVPFCAAFTLEANQVELNSSQRIVNVDVGASRSMLDSLTVTSLNSELAAKLTESAKIRISVISKLPLKDEEFRVAVSSSLTGQRQLLLVKYTTSEETKEEVATSAPPSTPPPSSPMESSQSSFYFVIILLVVFLLSLCFLFGRATPSASSANASHPVFQPISPVTPPAPSFGSGSFLQRQSADRGSGTGARFTPVGSSGNVRSAQKPKLFSES